MQRLLRFSLLGLLPFLSAWAQEALHTSTITLSVGGETPFNNYVNESSGPIFNGNYEFRIWKYLALEAGVNTMLPARNGAPYEDFILPGANLVSYPSSYIAVPQSGRTRVTFLPFGFKGILPLANQRLELFAGFGGAYAFHADGSYLNQMLIRGSLGGRFALDKGHHYWVGTSGQYFSNVGGSNRQEWLSWTADFGWRFGH